MENKMVFPIPKNPPERDAQYRKWLRTLSCARSYDNRGSECHHESTVPCSGLSIKCSDYDTLPLHPDFHRNRKNARHRIGRDEFWGSFDWRKAIINYNIEYVNKYPKRKGTAVLIYRLFTKYGVKA